MKTSTQLRRLRAAVVAAEGVHERIRQSVFQQRRATQSSINADILQRCGPAGSLPPPMRGAAAPLTPLQVAANAERAKLADLEIRLSAAAAALSAVRGELLACEELILSERRERLALLVIARKASKAQNAELLSLCPPDTEVRLDQMFHLSPMVAHAISLIQGNGSGVNTPCNVLAGTAPSEFDWSATRRRILEQHAA